MNMLGLRVRALWEGVPVYNEHFGATWSGRETHEVLLNEQLPEFVLVYKLDEDTLALTDGQGNLSHVLARVPNSDGDAVKVAVSTPDEVQNWIEAGMPQAVLESGKPSSERFYSRGLFYMFYN